MYVANLSFFWLGTKKWAERPEIARDSQNQPVLETANHGQSVDRFLHKAPFSNKFDKKSN